MARVPLSSVTVWITAAAVQHGAGLAAAVAERTGVTRRTARRLLARLVELGWLQRSGSPRRPHYLPGAMRQVVRRYALAGLDEDLPWTRDFAPCFDLPLEIRRMTRHAFTELLNNAIDHSEGLSVTVSLRQTPTQVQLLVSDDGCGLFSQIQRRFEIADPLLAMLELSKGRLTSAPQGHTGRGLYFTALLADVIDLHANDTAFQRREWDRRGWLPARALPRQGTTVYVAIALDTPRTLDAVMRSASLDGAGYALERTRVPMRLLAAGGQALDSRAQAKRVAARLAQFRRADIDFDGIEAIGHSFADELFRVFARAHRECQLVPVNMGPQVAAMVETVARSP